MDRDECIEALTSLGFTGLEAEVYAALVESSPATAYKVAQDIGKAAANVYKAVESLERKGAIIVEEAASRMCRAVPPSELLAQLERQFAHAKSRAKSALARLGEPQGDERVYPLTAVDQILARAKAMAARATERMLCDLFPLAAQEVADDLNRAARRGVAVNVQLYAPPPRGLFDKRIVVFAKPDGDEILGRWDGQWLNLVVDAREHLLAFLEPDLGGVHQALYSESVYLSLLHFSGFASEMLASMAETLLASDDAPPRFRRAHAAAKKALMGTDLPGYRMLLDRFGKPRAHRPGD